MTNQVTAGFLPLLDSAILVAAKVFGFAEEEGIELSLARETSWANIRDRMAIGHFDAAHMLAPMPIAANLGLTQMPVNLVAPMALGLGGNAVTVSKAIVAEMEEFGSLDGIKPAHNGALLAQVVRKRVEHGENTLRFGVVHPHSGHNLELRYWLSACGIRPDVDVEIVVLPPPLMPDALSSGRVDAICVGEPWNSVAVDAGSGRIVTVKSAIWRSSPEKVLALNAGCLDDNADRTDRLLRALYNAAQWCGLEENHQALAVALSGADYLGHRPEIIGRALSGKLMLGGGEVVTIEDFFVPSAKAATFPWQSHALWFYSQLVRWGMVDHTKKNIEIVIQSYRPDICRRALSPLNASLPSANAKVEGALTAPTPVGATSKTLILGPDGFFDGKVFDPDQLEGYLGA